MDSNQDQENQDVFGIEIVDEGSDSIEDFIRQLEAREKDLHIPSDLAIEIDEADFDDTNPEEFVKSESQFIPVKIIEPNKNRNHGPGGKSFSDLEGEVDSLTAKLERAEADRSELTTTMRRRQLDFENFRKRIERERNETFVNQLINLASQMLPVIDNLDRALVFAENHSNGRSSDFQEFFHGIALVSQQLNEVLEEMGIVPIISIGEPFDPNIHEAVATERTNDVPPNTVTAELLRGFRVGEKVIRAAMVRVAVGPDPG